MDKIVLYSTNCPMCNMLKSELDKRNIDYTVCTDVNEMLERGFKAAPVLQVGDNVMNAQKALQWVKGM